MKLSFAPLRSKKVVAVVAAVLLITAGSVHARYGAFAYSTGSGSFGAWGLSWNWRTAGAAINSAVSTARYQNGGWLDGYRYAWWSHRGWEAGARGYDWSGSRVSVGWARGWRTRPAAVNYAVNRLGYNTYSLGYVSGYNN